MQPHQPHHPIQHFPPISLSLFTQNLSNSNIEITEKILKMVRYAAGPSQPTSPPKGPIPASAIPLRRLSAVILIILLYTSAQPFTPFYWLLSIDGSLLFDRFFSGALLLAGLYFQWKIASRTQPVACIIPVSSFGMGDDTIRSGNVGKRDDNDFVWIYRPSEYWFYAGVEAALLCVAEWAGFEMLRRGLIVGVLAALWGVGWFVTPESVKTKAWETMKRVWFWLAVNEVMRFGNGGGSRGRRRW
jgi:hypothetical protein